MWIIIWLPIRSVAHGSTREFTIALTLVRSLREADRQRRLPPDPALNYLICDHSLGRESRPSIHRESALLKSLTFCCACLVFAVTAAWADAPLKPVKVTPAEAAGPVFNRKDAVKENGPDGPATDVAIMSRLIRR